MASDGAYVIEIYVVRNPGQTEEPVYRIPDV
jgi:hypothetical protein